MQGAQPAVVGKFYHREGHNIPVQYLWTFPGHAFDSSEKLVFLEPHCLLFESKKGRNGIERRKAFCYV